VREFDKDLHLFLLDVSIFGLLLWVVINVHVIIHELGHMLSVVLLGGKIRGFSLVFFNGFVQPHWSTLPITPVNATFNFASGFFATVTVGALLWFSCENLYVRFISFIFLIFSFPTSTYDFMMIYNVNHCRNIGDLLMYSDFKEVFPTGVNIMAGINHLSMVWCVFVFIVCMRWFFSRD
jgi:hypothetical protein